MNLIRTAFCLLSGLTLIGCAAMLVPVTNDPIDKINWATELFNNQDRPLPAETLLREAIDICEKSNDLSCLGQAYRTYGFFFRSPTIEKWQKYYRKNGFIDKAATYDNRLIKSKEYFEKAVNYFMKTNEYSRLTNAYLNLGFAHNFINNTEAECVAYARSLEYNIKNLEKTPDAKVSLPGGVSSYKEYLAIHQKRAGCKSSYNN